MRGIGVSETKRKGAMAKGMSVHLGLNAVDPKHYQGWDGVLQACEADAGDMGALAKSQKFATKVLLTKQATRGAATKAIEQAAGALKSGDTFLLSYSGHGGQLPDQNGDEPDGQDETWCLYDGELVDDEIFLELGKFRSGVRILVLSDSCHSGSVVKVAHYAARINAVGDLTQVALPGEAAQPRFRFMPSPVALRTYLANRDMYDRILKNVKGKNAKQAVKASVLLISGCQDNQLSSDGTFNGLFTGTLKRVWNGGKFKKPYPDFHRSIVHLMPPDQTPAYFKVGSASPAFEHQRPFTV